MSVGVEAQRDRDMVDAIRQMRGLDPLYAFDDVRAARKRKGLKSPLYGVMLTHPGWLYSQQANPGHRHARN